MIFIVRTTSDWRTRWLDNPRVRVVLTRLTPAYAATATGQTDLVCIGDEAAADCLQAAGWTVVALRDGWYADDHGGGVAVWGQGAFWEIRATPFVVTEACGSVAETDAANAGEALDVRRGIFGV